MEHRKNIEELLRQAHSARAQENYGDARIKLTRAFELARENGDERSMGTLHAFTAQLERDEGRLGDALDHYRLALTKYQKSRADALTLSHVLRHVADVERELGLLALATTHYREVIEAYRSHPASEPLDMGNALRGFALLQEALGERGEAEEFWAHARSLYHRAGVREGVEECDRRMAALQRGKK